MNNVLQDAGQVHFVDTRRQTAKRFQQFVDFLIGRRVDPLQVLGI